MSPEPDDPRHQWVPIDGHPSVHNPHGYLHMEKSDSVKNEVKMEPLDYPQTSQAAAAQVQAHAAQAEQYQQWMAHAYGASIAGSMVYQTQPYHQQIEVQHHAIGFA